jgi:hypothetical protein
MFLLHCRITHHLKPCHKKHHVAAKDVYGKYSTYCKTNLLDTVTPCKFGALIGDVFPCMTKSRKYHPVRSYWAYLGLQFQSCISGKENCLTIDQLSVIAEKHGFHLYLGSSNIKVMAQEKNQACITVNKHDMAVDNISYAGNDVVRHSFPKILSCVQAAEYTLKRLLSLRPCQGYDVSVNQKKIHIVSKHCVGYVFSSNKINTTNCKSCSIEKSRNSPKSTTTEVFEHVEHNYARKRSAAATPSCAAATPSCATTPESVEASTSCDEADLTAEEDSESEDPTYSPDNEKKRSQKIPLEVVDAQQIVENLIKTCPSLEKIGEDFKTLLLSQIKNSATGSRQRRWDDR